MIKADLHTHICKTKFNSMLVELRKSGLNTYGISEHVYQIRELREMYPDFYLEGQVFDIDEYQLIFNQFQDPAGINLLMGLELDLIPGFTETAWTIVKDIKWDYIIGSLHELSGWDIHDKCTFSKKESHQKWQKYIETQIKWIHSGCCDVLGHPIRMAVTVPELPGTIDDLLEELAIVAKENRVAIEVNARDVEISEELVKLLIKKCKKIGTSISVGSDAHFPSEIACNFKKIEELMNAFELRYYSIFNKRKEVVINL